MNKAWTLSLKIRIKLANEGEKHQRMPLIESNIYEMGLSFPVHFIDLNCEPQHGFGEPVLFLDCVLMLFTFILHLIRGFFNYFVRRVQALDTVLLV